MFDTAKPFLLSLALGLLLGIERERAAGAQGHAAVFGARTLALMALLGTLAAHLAPSSAGVAFALAAFAAAIVVAAYVHAAAARDRDVGTTTEVAAILTFGLGWLSHGEPRLAAMLGVIVLAVLWLKPRIHAFAHAGLSDAEVNGALVFLVIALVVLPLLPDHPIDPWGIVNPSRLWLLFVLIAGLGFAGYIAVRALGPARGLAAAGFFAGLVSSTAATLSLSRRVRSAVTMAPSLTVGIVLANVASAAAQVFIVALANRPLLPAAAVLLAAPVATGAAGAGVAWWTARRRGDQASVDFRLPNPLELKPALAMAALFGGILILSAVAQRIFGAQGAVAAAGLAGATDVHGATLAASTLAAAGSIGAVQALTAILVAFVANMAVKIGIVAFAGGRRLFPVAAPPLALMALAAAGAFFLARAVAGNPISGAAP